MKILNYLLAAVIVLFQNTAIANSFAECPSSPNCVSSQSLSTSHKIEHLNFAETLEDFKHLISFFVREMPRLKIIKQTENSVQLEATSLIFRFVDDVEFYFDQSNSVLHVRSASRLGYSDLGANRKRVEEFRNLLIKFQASNK